MRISASDAARSGYSKLERRSRNLCARSQSSRTNGRTGREGSLTRSRTTDKIDTVGAGDSVVSGIAACLSIGSPPAEAASFGNLVAGVTVQKLHQTGTATPDEIRALHRCATYMELD